MTPFELSWMCCIEPSNLAEELHSLKIGSDSINWYKSEIEKYSEIVRAVDKESQQLEPSTKGSDKAERQKADEKIFAAFAKTFAA